MKKKIVASLLGLLGLIGCKISHPPKLDPESFMEWYSSEKNVSNFSVFSGKVEYRVSFYPKQVSIATCAISKCEDKKTLLSDMESKPELETYLLDLRTEDIRVNLFDLAESSQMSRQEQIIYLNNDIKSDLIAITQKKDTLKCVSVIYEPMISNTIRLLVDFEKPDVGYIMKIIFNDQLISQSEIHFTFEKNYASDFPLLNLKNYEK